ncbi:hypothetical protein AWN68_17700 [Roseivirga echinicomitans]|uniref:HTH LytTR-type domain-containing protein n=2 Tax=Roseivirga echinicomitans TaxID=296218 RepID=A0A150XLL8_9BACT|nr:hypothetical protein AWN68_17700 [Roseivirga echinicomitans]
MGMTTERQDNILIPTTKGLQLEKTNNIQNICAEGSYCELMLISGAKHMISKNLSSLTKLLPSHTFFRIHTSVVINIAHIKEVIGTEVVMSNDCRFPIAQRRKKEFVDFLKRNSLSL